ncbi:hypothetical protein BJP36_39035 [Moorena producens JHB]|uniref:Uncharacterized protein n=1 Tax=Moorena producens (strain JHB) TaxID=1454205 RepID=A0A9Q9SUS6_MOOP1|nr:hypothetical protein [Moorena producens]WAN70061.1 hypothetical protein BJP36_39035 [Moorena producens JHB]
MAVGVGWANTKRKAISSLCHVHLPTKQDPRLAVGHATLRKRSQSVAYGLSFRAGAIALTYDNQAASIFPNRRSHCSLFPVPCSLFPVPRRRVGKSST